MKGRRPVAGRRGEGDGRRAEENEEPDASGGVYQIRWTNASAGRLNRSSISTQEEELPAVPVELSQVDAELVDGGSVAVLVKQRGELLDLLRRQLGA